MLVNVTELYFSWGETFHQEAFHLGAPPCDMAVPRTGTADLRLENSWRSIARFIHWRIFYHEKTSMNVKISSSKHINIKIWINHDKIFYLVWSNMYDQCETSMIRLIRELEGRIQDVNWNFVKQQGLLHPSPASPCCRRQSCPCWIYPGIDRIPVEMPSWPPWPPVSPRNWAK